MIAAGLRAGNLKTFAKTTGTSPRIIDQHGNDKYIHRLRTASIGEQISLIRYFAKEKPDVLVIDQLDKVHIEGSFARTDEKLRAIYTGTREIAKRRSCAIIGISQASADASGKLDITFDMLFHLI